MASLTREHFGPSDCTGASDRSQVMNTLLEATVWKISHRCPLGYRRTMPEAILASSSSGGSVSVSLRSRPTV